MYSCDGITYDKVRTISDHIKKIYSDNELEENWTIRKYRIVQIEGQEKFLKFIPYKMKKLDFYLYENYSNFCEVTIISLIHDCLLKLKFVKKNFND